MYPRSYFPASYFPKKFFPAPGVGQTVPPPTPQAGLQCRAGIARAGAYRAGFYTPNVFVLVDGVDVTRSVLIKSVTIHEAPNDQPNTASFGIKPGAGITLVPLQRVTIALGAATNPIFAGQIQRLVRTYTASVAGVQRWLTAECIDVTELFNRRLVTKTWRGVSFSSIAADVVAIANQGSAIFTMSGLQEGLPTIDEFVAVDESPTSVLQRGVHLFNGTYRFKLYDLHLFGPGSDASPNAYSSPAPLTDVVRSLKAGARLIFDDDTAQLRNESVVDGKQTRCPIGTPDGQQSIVVNASVSIDYFLMAGGGGGGSSIAGGGGGGGGGFGIYGSIVSAGTYPVVIGAGGIPGDTGGDTTFLGQLRHGGGRGGNANQAGGAGGCGGGGNGNTQPGGPGLSGEGYGGGTGDFTLAGNTGGGGGAPGGVGGAAGGAGQGGNGAPGVLWAISGTPTYYGGGGGGRGSASGGAGGLGGGGAAGVDGTDGYGGGGGAQASGGSGVAIISYPDGALAATGGVITHVSGKTIHTFTASGDFVVSTVTLTAPIPQVSDLPVDDAGQLEPGGGTVRIGTQIVTYNATIGPHTPPGENAPGSTLTSDRLIGSTNIPVASIAPFADQRGWVKVGDQIIRYDSKSASALEGVTALGFGAFTAAVATGAPVTWIDAIALSPDVEFNPALEPGVAIIQQVVVRDAAAAAAIAAVEGGDGVHQSKAGTSGLSVAGSLSVGFGEVANFGAAIQAMQWTTEDMNAHVGTLQAVKFDDLDASLVITKVDITFPTENRTPLRRCEAATVPTSALLDAVVTKQQ